MVKLNIPCATVLYKVMKYKNHILVGHSDESNHILTLCHTFLYLFKTKMVRSESAWFFFLPHSPFLYWFVYHKKFAYRLHTERSITSPCYPCHPVFYWFAAPFQLMFLLPPIFREPASHHCSYWGDWWLQSLHADNPRVQLHCEGTISSRPVFLLVPESGRALKLLPFCIWSSSRFSWKAQ